MGRNMKICIILLVWLNIKLAFSSEIRDIANWSDLVLQTQNSRRMQILLDTNLAEMDGQQLKETYYELVPQVQQNSCQILKKIGGAWMKNCGFWDGEKLICMDKLYPSIKNDSCLVYSFGLSDNWDFEIIMARAGCTVHAYDPSNHQVIRPQNSFHPNIHYHKVGLGHKNEGVNLYSPSGTTEEIEIRTLDTLIRANGDQDKIISYLKVDIEGSEIQSLKQWLNSGILKKIQQIGIEMHTGKMTQNSLGLKKKSMFRSLLHFLQVANRDFGFVLSAYNANGCIAKQSDDQRLYYSYHDILLINS